MEKWKLCLVITLLFLIASGTSNAAIDWDITTGHETIENGDTFDRVTIYNSAIVDMTGGEVNILRPYSNASLNVSGGHVGILYVNGTSTVNLTNGLIDSITVGQNISDDLSIIFDCDLSSIIRTYDQGKLAGLEGNWSNGTAFDIEIQNQNAQHPTGDYIQIIPEPISIVFLGFGGLLIRVRRS